MSEAGPRELTFAKGQWERMRELAESAYPFEGCGVLGGRALDGGWEVSEVFPGRNLVQDRRHDRYSLPASAPTPLTDSGPVARRAGQVGKSLVQLVPETCAPLVPVVLRQRCRCRPQQPSPFAQPTSVTYAPRLETSRSGWAQAFLVVVEHAMQLVGGGLDCSVMALHMASGDRDNSCWQVGQGEHREVLGQRWAAEAGYERQSQSGTYEVQVQREVG